MTKKLEKIVAKYNEKLEVEVFMFEKGFNNIDEAMDKLKAKRKEFFALIENMYFYDLLSEKDFLFANNEIALSYYEKAVDKVFDIKHNVA